ncbi:protein phosphatase 1, regulatory subunit 17-like isoform X2 [Hoplias malabaricus]|uniref:protein phosphatase 1, regulatory subunit 17-like isoform X2 n=1 Tax=Hoplias malabaricus TaxID=27720 RepID=UPI003462930C
MYYGRFECTILKPPDCALPDEGSEMDRQKHSVEESQQDEMGQKKPRRKDTPVLNSPPLIPGVRLMKGEPRLIHLEDEEKEAKK